MSSFPPAAQSHGRIVRDTLRRLLNPITDTEDLYVEWLCGWDDETCETFAKMAMRLRFTGDPTIDPTVRADLRHKR